MPDHHSIDVECVVCGKQVTRRSAKLVSAGCVCSSCAPKSQAQTGAPVEPGTRAKAEASVPRSRARALLSWARANAGVLVMVATCLFFVVGAICPVVLVAPLVILVLAWPFLVVGVSLALAVGVIFLLRDLVSSVKAQGWHWRIENVGNAVAIGVLTVALVGGWYKWAVSPAERDDWDSCAAYGNKLCAEGKAKDAEVFFDLALERAVTVHGSESPEAAVCYQNLGFYLYEHGNRDHAMNMLSAAAKLLRDEPWRGSSIPAQARAFLAVAYAEFGMCETADTHYQQAIAQLRGRERIT